MDVNTFRADTEYGPSDWRPIDQARIDAFAEATGDHQWIHTDAERAAAGPFGATIAHGWLSLAIMAPFVLELLPLGGATVVNYGADRVRFPSPLPVGSEIRVLLRIAAMTPVGDGVQLAVTGTTERRGGTKPVCVADLLLRVGG